MSLKIACEACGAKLAIKDEAQGRTIKCPKCGAMIGVPVERIVLPIVVEPDAGLKLPIDLGDDDHEPASPLSKGKARSPQGSAGILLKPWQVFSALATLALLLVIVVVLTLGRTADVPPADEASTTISDDEATKLVDMALDQWTSAVEQYRAAPSANTHAFQERKKANLDATIHRISAPYRDLLDELTQYFPDSPSKIYLGALSTPKHVRVSIGEVLSGALFLMKNSSYPEKNTQKFGAFSYQYGMWREQGLDHKAAIQKLFDLKKF
jgi:hypothetical protein